MKGNKMAKPISDYMKKKLASEAKMKADLFVHKAKHASDKKKKLELLQLAGRNEETALLLLAEVTGSKNKK